MVMADLADRQTDPDDMESSVASDEQEAQSALSDDDDGSIPRQTDFVTEAEDEANQSADIKEYNRNHKVLTQSRIGNSQYTLSISQVVELPLEGLLHSRDVNESHVTAICDSMLAGGGPVKSLMILRACVDARKYENIVPSGNVEMDPKDKKVSDLICKITKGSCPIYILSGHHRFLAGKKYGEKCQELNESHDVQMQVELYDIHTINLEAALYVIARDNEADPRMLPKLKTDWMDHADVVRRVILAQYHVATTIDTDLQGLDMVQGSRSVDEDVTIELIRNSVLAGMVGNYRAKTFLGKVNHLCWAALKPDDVLTERQSTNYIRPLKSLAFLPRHSFDQAKSLYKHLLPLDEPDGTPKAALTLLVRKGGTPEKQLLDFCVDVLDRYTQMIDKKETTKDGYAKGIRKLATKYKSKLRLKVPITLDTIEDVHIITAVGTDDTLTTDSHLDPSDDDNNTASPSMRSRRGGDSAMFSAKKPMMSGIAREDDDNEEENQEESEAKDKQDQEEDEEGDEHTSTRDNAPRRSSRLDQKRGIAPTSSKKDATPSKRIRTSVAKTTKGHSSLKSMSSSSTTKSHEKTYMFGPLLADGTMTINGTEHQVIEPVIANHLQLLYHSNNSGEKPTQRRARLLQREATFTGKAREQCRLLFTDCTLTPP